MDGVNPFTDMLHEWHNAPKAEKRGKARKKADPKPPLPERNPKRKAEGLLSLLDKMEKLVGRPLVTDEQIKGWNADADYLLGMAKSGKTPLPYPVETYQTSLHPKVT